MVTCTATLNTLATAYVGAGTWIGLSTATAGSNCGTGLTPSNEATGGSYARIQTTWGTVGAVTAGVSAGSACTINVAAATYNYMLVASSSSGNNMSDNVSITPVTLGSSGQIVCTPTYTQT